MSVESRKQMIESAYIDAINAVSLGQKTGRLIAVHGLVIEASGCDVQQGELVEIIQAKGSSRVQAEVIGLRDQRILLMPFSNVQGLCLNSTVIPLNRSLEIPLGSNLLGRVIDPLGEPLDDNGPLNVSYKQAFLASPINPLHRPQISKVLETGVRAIDVFCPLGQGQRVGIMAGSGVGKSTLLGMVTQHTNADIIIIAMIGERGREVGDFLRDCLGAEGLLKSVVIVAPAEQPAVLRRQAAYSATAIAEWFRSQNKNVLLIMDSITRFAMAQREIGLSTGEPIGSRGYPASVFALLPPLLERGGTLRGQGTITSIYTVLVEGDDITEPVADHMRSILDGHVVLTRDLAAAGHYPAIDVKNSVSRLNNKLLSARQQGYASKIRRSLNTYSTSVDLIDLGAYEKGRNSELDNAIKLKPKIEGLLMQAPGERSSGSETWASVEKISSEIIN